MEGRVLTKKIHDQDRTFRTPCRINVFQGLAGERQASVCHDNSR
jgi:hypothetical protein